MITPDHDEHAQVVLCVITDVNLTDVKIGSVKKIRLPRRLWPMVPRMVTPLGLRAAKEQAKKNAGFKVEILEESLNWI